MSISPVLGAQGVLALRANILERSASLQQAARSIPAVAIGGTTGASPHPSGFGDTLREALQAVNQVQQTSDTTSASWERGDTNDIAAVMLSRQKASIAFEATLQARNRLLSAYRDIMNMPV